MFGERGIRRGYVGSLWRGGGFKLRHSIQFGLFGLTSIHLQAQVMQQPSKSCSVTPRKLENHGNEARLQRFPSTLQDIPRPLALDSRREFAPLPRSFGPLDKMSEKEWCFSTTPQSAWTPGLAPQASLNPDLEPVTPPTASYTKLQP